MASLSVADRRALMITAMLEPPFRDALRNDPAAAIARVTGRPAPDLAIRVIEEQADAWEFVLPANVIEPDLPAPTDARGAVENDVYQLLRDEPGTRDRVVANPRAFLRERLEFDIGDTGVNVRQEGAGELLLILPFGDSREQLDDAALDLVSGGGDPGAQNGNANSQRTTPRPWK